MARSWQAWRFPMFSMPPRNSKKRKTLTTAEGAQDRSSDIATSTGVENKVFDSILVFGTGNIAVREISCQKRSFI